MAPLEMIVSIKQPCKSAHEWLAKQTDLEAAWNACERGDWLLWLIKQSKIANKLNGRTFAFMALEFAQLCAKPDEDPRITTCRAVTRKYLDGEAPLADLESAARSTRSATWSAWSAESAARSAAAAWLDSAAAASWSAESAESAAESSWSACLAAESASASWRQQAEIVRKHFTFAEVLEACK